MGCMHASAGSKRYIPASCRIRRGALYGVSAASRLPAARSPKLAHGPATVATPGNRRRFSWSHKPAEGS